MYDNVRPVSVPRPALAEHVSALEAHIGCRMPAGYAEFVTRFGRGLLGGFVRIYTPDELLHGPSELASWRARIDEYWFWDTGPLRKEQALEYVILGDTVGGDEFVFHPGEPDLIYVLSHDFDISYFAGRGLEAALAWLFKSGVLDEPFGDDTFEPY